MTTSAVDRLRRALAIDRPILGAPMARIADANLARAVTAAGGLGFLGGGYGDHRWLLDQFAAVDPSTVGVGLISWRLDEQPDVLDLVLDHRPAAVWLSYGDPTGYVRRIRRAGPVAICQVLDLSEAAAALRAGADVLVVQGGEAGGHGRPGLDLAGLLPAVVELAGDTPVVGAGGIADGRDLAACWALGASGAALGTRLYATHEAADSDAVKARLCEVTGDETLHTTVFDLLRGPRWPPGYTGRAVRNAITDRWHGRESDLEADLDREVAAYRVAAAAGDLDTRVIWAGEGVDRIDEVLPAAEVLEAIHAEAAQSGGAPPRN